MALFWIVHQVGGERRVRIQSADAMIFARLRAAIGGFKGTFIEAHPLDAKTAKRIPKQTDRAIARGHRGGGADPAARSPLDGAELWRRGKAREQGGWRRIGWREAPSARGGHARRSGDRGAQRIAYSVICRRAPSKVACGLAASQCLAFRDNVRVIAVGRGHSNKIVYWPCTVTLPSSTPTRRGWGD